MAKPSGSKKPKLENDEERRQRHMSAIDAARAKVGNLNPRDMAEVERRAVLDSGLEHRPLTDEA